jgi:hypothetical protein
MASFAMTLNTADYIVGGIGISSPITDVLDLLWRTIGIVAAYGTGNGRKLKTSPHEKGAKLASKRALP